MFQDEEYFAQLEKELEEEREREIQRQRSNAPMMFGSEYNDNLVKWQLDIKEELERIEHLLRKHIPKRDEQGNEYFEKPDAETELFNETGVQEILNLLAWYLNKNIILSNFSEEDIKLRVHQFSAVLTDFIHNNYERFGLDNKDKIKHFPMVIMNIVNTVEAAYNRALGGGERESLRTARQVYQTEPIGHQMGMQQNMPPQNAKKFSFINPRTWT